MRTAKVSIAAVALLAIALTIGSRSVAAQDMVKTAPKNCTVVLDNDHVRVIRVVLKPGDKLPMHSHGANIVYTLTGGKTKYTFPDGKTEERENKSGTAIWSDSVTHATENIGSTETRALVVEIKK